jgi:hypothetical protein
VPRALIQAQEFHRAAPQGVNRIGGGCRCVEGAPGRKREAFLALQQRLERLVLRVADPRCGACKHRARALW